MEEAPMVSGGYTCFGGLLPGPFGGPMMGEPIKSENSTLL